jgi:glycosyltransferase involved in cell wall biosynthesis
MESISVTIPAYNEEENIENAIREADDFLKTTGRDYEILIINDGSADKTGEIVERIMEENSHVRIFHHKQNRGFGGAQKSCYDHATKDLIFLAPADGQVKMKDIQKYLDKIEDADVVVGYRLNRPEAFRRRLTSGTFHWVLRVLLGLNYKELTTCVLYRKKVLDAVHLVSESAFLEAEVIYKAQNRNFIIKEVGVQHYERQAGESKGGYVLVILKTIWDLVKFSAKVRFSSD